MKYSIVVLLMLLSCFQIKAQVIDVVSEKEMTFTELDKALKNPEAVKRLDLSGRDLQLSDEVLKRFKNLEYLSLKDDHLKKVPHGIVYLSNLKVLDLSGNDIEKLPRFMKRLKSLEEVFLNDETNLDVDQSLSMLNRLPNLKSLHIENDGLETFPLALSKFKSLEKLYLNNNKIEAFPTSIKLPESLQFIDLRMNQIGREIDKENRFGKGLIIKF